jgi:hypothetical protein
MPHIRMHTVRDHVGELQGNQTKLKLKRCFHLAQIKCQNHLHVSSWSAKVDKYSIMFQGDAMIALSIKETRIIKAYVHQTSVMIMRF